VGLVMVIARLLVFPTQLLSGVSFEFVLVSHAPLRIAFSSPLRLVTTLFLIDPLVLQ
jgi:hypothetical protein